LSSTGQVNCRLIQIKEQEKNLHNLVKFPPIVTTDLRRVIKIKPKKSLATSRLELIKINPTILFEDIFNNFLETRKKFDIERNKKDPSNLRASFADEIKPTDTKVKNCFIKQVYKVMNIAFANPKIDQFGNTIGYHISSRNLDPLRKNRLYKYFGFFIRCDKSTYHANSAKGKESNGYSHWYTFSKELKCIRAAVNKKLRLAIKFGNCGLNKEYNKKVSTYKKAPKNFVFDSVNYCKIAIEPFLWELYLFDNYCSNTFAMILTHVKYSDGEHVYIENTTKESKSKSSKGRAYSVVGLMKKEMRERLFTGLLEVDLSCSVQSLMLNLGCQNTTKKSNLSMKNGRRTFPEISKMLDDKYLYRLYYSSAFNTTREQAKTIIQHIAYSPQSRIIHIYMKDTSTASKVIGEKTVKNISKATKHIEPLIKDSLLLRKLVLNRFYFLSNKNDDYSYKIGDLTLADIPKLVDKEIEDKNEKLSGNGKGRSLESRRYAQIYFLIENQVRNCMIEYIEKIHEEDGGIEVYQIHDAILFKNRHLKYNRDIADYVKEKLGFEVSLEKKFYK
jgi:hypothetical protein